MRITSLLSFIFVSVIVCSTHAKVLDTLVVEGLLSPLQLPIVRNQVSMVSGDSIQSSQMQEAIKRLYRLGLFRSADFFITAETDSSVSLLLKIQEYPTVEKHEFSGSKKLTKDDLEKAITLRDGRTLSDAAIYENVRAIKKAYAEKGYLRAEVQCDTIPTKIPGNVIAKFKIKEGPKVQVKKISFKGNVAYKEKKLKWKFKTKERRLLWGGDFDMEVYKLQLDSLMMFYNDEGYLDAEVVRDTFWFESNNKDVNIEVTLNEGRKFFRGDLFFTGNKVLENSDLESGIAMRRGKPFNKTKFEMTMEAVQGRYREEGYLWVQVKDKRVYRGDTIDVTFDIVEGVPAIVRKIDIKGNTKTMEKVIRREIRLMPGRKYKQSLMARSVREIMQLNFFGNALPDLKPNDDGTVDFVFDIQEKENIGQLQVGASYSKVEKLQGTFTTSIPNFRGTGQTLDLNLAGGRTALSGSVGFTEPWAFDTPTLLRGEIFGNRRVYELTGGDDTTVAFGFRATVGRRLKWPDDYFSLSSTYELSYQDQYGGGTDQVPDFNLLVLRQGILSKLSLSIQRNDCDLPTFPTRGTVFYLRPELAGLGGDFKFLKAVAGTDTYFPLAWKFVLGTHTKFGLIRSLGSSPMSVDRRDLFSGGGEAIVDDAVVRGYSAYSFGGQSYRSGFYRYEKGLTMLSLSTEISFPIVDQMLYLLAFGDMGNTWSDVGKIDLKDLYRGFGVGARISIPMLGLLGFDLGWGLDDLNRDRHFFNRYQPHAQLHFTMGKGY